MSNLFLRTISGIFIILIFLGALFFGKYTSTLLFLIIYAGSLYELRRMFLVKAKPLFIISLFTGMVIIAAAPFVFNQNQSSFFFPILIYCSILITIAILLFRNLITVGRKGIIPAGLFILTGSLLAYYLLGQNYDEEGYDPRLMVFLILLIWVNDVGAYAVGSLAGRNPLARRISAGKTWEGFAGGLILTCIAAFFIPLIIFEDQSFNWIYIGAIVSVSAVVGDLFESKIKRIANVKDSGSIIPGHGGMLDRFDSLLFVAPIFYVAFYLIIGK